MSNARGPQLVVLALIVAAAVGALSLLLAESASDLPSSPTPGSRATPLTPPQPKASAPPRRGDSGARPPTDDGPSTAPTSAPSAPSSVEALARVREQPLLRVRSAAGLPLEAEVSTLEGERLARGRGEVRVPGPPGLPVRVSAPGQVPEVLPLPAREAEVVLEAGRLLRGEVVAAEDQRPLAGARVEAMASLTHSDERGGFALVVAEEGHAELLVSAPQRPATRAREPAPGTPLRIEVPRGVGARGRVRRSDGQPPGAVELLVVGGRQLHRSLRARSAPDGGFALASGLHPGEQVMLFARAADGWQTPRAPAWQADLGALSATLEPPAELVLPEPCALEPVHAWPGEAPRRAPAREHRDLAPGRYRLLPAGGEPQEVELAPGERRELRIQPPPPKRDAALIVRALDELGAPVAGAEVEALVEGALLSARCDAGGVAELRLPAAALEGSLTITGRAPERVAIPAVAAPGEHEVELVLARRVALELQVSPPQAVEVALFRGEAALARARTGADGCLRLEGLPAGLARLVIETAKGEELERELRLPTSAPVRVALE